MNSEEFPFLVAEKGAEEVSNDSVKLVSKDKTFEELILWIYIPEEYPDYIGYYGPAETAEEAEALSKEFKDTSKDA